MIKKLCFPFLLAALSQIVTCNACEVHVATDTIRIGVPLKEHQYEGCLDSSVRYLCLKEDVCSIPDWCFAMNGSLVAVSIPQSVSVIGNNTFFACKGLSTIGLENVVEIGDGAFHHSALKSVDLSRATRLGDYAFADCERLSEVCLSDSIQYVGDFAFHGDTSLRKYDMLSGHIGAGAFSSCTGLVSVTLRGDTTEVGLIDEGAFMNCRSLQEIMLPCGLEHLPDMAFMGCKSLRDIELPESLQTIGENAFAETALCELIIPASVRSIGAFAFANCMSLHCVYMESKNTTYEPTSFDPSVEIVFL